MRKVLSTLVLAVSLTAGALAVAAPSAQAATACNPVVPSGVSKTPIKSSRWAYRHAHAWVYGDSITYQTWANLHSTTQHLAVDAWWGRSTASGVLALGKDVHHFPRHLPDVVVMATGTNDLSNLPAFAHQVALARAVLPKRVRLVWVNVYVTTTPTYNGADRILADAPGVGVLRWSALNLSSSTPLLVDGIHVNAQGCDARNALIRNAL